ncbi:hypothetical protein GpartN1_g5516.t1 [Galdieria partita]|uniref:tRNA(adenine(34)) deaminase n=1 Tax=Galdieria partita TaxID=83374 RepID=A0A9C7Q0B4_9RHOD|nr:hypothetical protein GpartN1_g5516.t1 [Galdieria partita]
MTVLFVIPQHVAIPGWLYQKKRARIVWQKYSNTLVCQSQHEHFMRIALELAKQSFYQREVPIGAVLVNAKGEVIAKGRNQVETTKDPTQHAELQCIQAGAKVCGNWRLLNTTLYSTLEPCAMCLSALQLARVSLVVYGAKDFRLGAIESWYPLVQVDHPFHQITFMGGILEEECAEWIRKFFFNIRRNKSLEIEVEKCHRDDH